MLRTTLAAALLGFGVVAGVATFELLAKAATRAYSSVREHRAEKKAKAEWDSHSWLWKFAHSII